MTPKLLIAAVLAAAIAVGLALPASRGGEPKVNAQIPIQEIGRG